MRLTPAAAAKAFGLTLDEYSLIEYFNDTMADDRIWCKCGDEIIHDPPHCDPVYYDKQGQYACWICYEYPGDDDETSAAAPQGDCAPL